MYRRSFIIKLLSIVLIPILNKICVAKNIHTDFKRASVIDYPSHWRHNPFVYVFLNGKKVECCQEGDVDKGYAISFDMATKKNKTYYGQVQILFKDAESKKEYLSIYGDNNV